jgi:hypothetical protein
MDIEPVGNRPVALLEDVEELDLGEMVANDADRAGDEYALHEPSSTVRKQSAP